jgi:hypothetical protein
VDYWFYYFENGNKKEEGHFIKNKNANGGFYYSNEEINKMWNLNNGVEWFFRWFIEVIRLFEPKNILWVKKQKNGIW